MLLMRPCVLRSYVNIELLLELLANAPTFEHLHEQAGRQTKRKKHVWPQAISTIHVCLVAIEVNSLIDKSGGSWHGVFDESRCRLELTRGHIFLVLPRLCMAFKTMLRSWAELVGELRRLVGVYLPASEERPQQSHHKNNHTTQIRQQTTVILDPRRVSPTHTFIASSRRNLASIRSSSGVSSSNLEDSPLSRRSTPLASRTDFANRLSFNCRIVCGISFAGYRHAQTWKVENVV